MASSVYLNNLVYSYLQKLDPKCASLFRKSNEVDVNKLPPNFPALEDIVESIVKNKGLCATDPQAKGIQVSSSDKDNSTKKQNGQSFSKNLSSNSNLNTIKNVIKPISQTKKAATSSSSDSDSSSNFKQNLSRQMSTLQKGALKKGKESSSDSSDSEDDNVLTHGKSPSKMTSVMQVNNIVSNKNESLSIKANVNNIKNVSKPILQTKEASSSGSDSDSSSSSKQNLLSNQMSTLQKVTQVRRNQSSSDSSESEDKDASKTTSVSKLTKQESMPHKSNLNIVKNTIKSLSQTKKGSSSSDSDSSSSFKNNLQSSQMCILQNVAKKKKENSNDTSDSEDEEASKVLKKSPAKEMPLKKANNCVSNKQESSTSESEDDTSTLNSTSQDLKGILKKKAHDSSSSDDSDSENENRKIKQNKVISKEIVQPALSVPNKSGNSASKKKATSGTDNANNWSNVISKFTAEFSDSESEDEKGVMVSLSKKCSTAKNSNNMVRTPLKLSHNSLQKESLASSSCVDETSSTNVQRKLAKTSRNPEKKFSLIAKKQGGTSSDSSSESDGEQMETNVHEEHSKRDLNIAGKKVGSLVIPSYSAKLSVKKSPITTKQNESSSTSSSDSEVKNPIKVKELATKLPVPSVSVKNKAFEEKLDQIKIADTSGTLKKGKQTRSDSSSDFEDDKPEQVRPQLTAKLPNLSTSFAKQASSDSSSDSEDEKPEQIKPKLAAKSPTMSTSFAKQASSDSSSDSEDEKPEQSKPKLTAKSPKLSTSFAKQASSDSSSDSEDEKPERIKPKLATKSPNLSTSFVKHASSGSSSDSEDEKPEQVRPKLTAMSSNLPTGLAKPASSDSSSDSEDEKPGQVKPQLVAKSSNMSTSFAKQASSDSSSDSEDGNPEQVKPQRSSLTLLQQNKRKRESSDSTSDSDDNVQSEGNVLTSKLKISKRKRDSSDSDSEDSQPKTLSSRNKSAKKVQKFNSHFITKENNHDSLKNVDESKTSDSIKKHRGSSPFRRIKSENVEIDYRLQQSSQLAKLELPKFEGVRGKQFRHEKTKKKNSHSFGKIDTSVKSIKFH